MGMKYKGYEFDKIYEIIDLKTGNLLVHGYSIKHCKMLVDEELRILKKNKESD